MRTELPAERLHRRLGSCPEPTDPGAESTTDPTTDPGADPGAVVAAAERAQDADDAGDGHADPTSLLPRWLPDRVAQQTWLARVRADPGRSGALALAVVAAIAVLVTVFTLMRDQPAPVRSAKLPPVEMVSSASPGSAVDQPAAEQRPVVVSVVGLVHAPGLVTLTPGARIADALAAAGGAVDGADTIGLNMARPLGDGEQIVVGLAPLPGQPKVPGSSVHPGSAGTGSPAAPGTVSGAAGRKPAEPVDLNTATVQQLDALPGVGPVTAAAIVAWREAHGRFASVDQLGDVEGIGPVRLDKLRALVRV